MSERSWNKVPHEQVETTLLRPGMTLILNDTIEPAGCAYHHQEQEIADRLGASVIARAFTIDGFVPKRLPGGGKLGDRDSYAGRASFVFTPSGEGGLRSTLTMNIDRQISDPFHYARAGQAEDAVQLDPELRVRRTLWGASLKNEQTAAFDCWCVDETTIMIEARQANLHGVVLGDLITLRRASGS